MIRLLHIIIINFIFCLGIESISLPNNALEIAGANSGIGNSQNIGLNFSNLNNDFLDLKKKCNKTIKLLLQ